MREIKVELTDEEVDEVTRWAPVLERYRLFIPSTLVSVVQKLETAMKGLE